MSDYKLLIGVDMTTNIIGDGKVIGKVAEKGVFTRRLKRSKHYFREFGGWAINKDALDQATDAGAKTVEIVETEQGIVYHAPTTAYSEFGEVLNYGYDSSSSFTVRIGVLYREQGGKPWNG